MYATTPATRHRLPAAFRQYLRNHTSHQTLCEQCVDGEAAHEHTYGVYHVFSTSRVGLLHEVRLNVEGVAVPSCSCEHGTLKAASAPLRCQHYLYARELHLERYGEMVAPDAREVRRPHIEVRVSWTNGVELFGEDETQQEPGPAIDWDEHDWGDEQRPAMVGLAASVDAGVLGLPAIWEAGQRHRTVDCGLTRVFDAVFPD
jgi:hypothetical protein